MSPVGSTRHDGFNRLALDRDLHAGPAGAPTLWPAAEEELRRDLERVHKHAGPFDFVLCAGDLVQSGASAELDTLTERLDGLFRHLEGLGSKPALLVVPGNHDLERPDPRSPAVRPLLHWSHDPELRGNLFWHETNGLPYRDIISGAFRETSRWLRAWSEAHPLPATWSRNDVGLLPGDFAASLRVDGASLGVVGLNSAALQPRERHAPRQHGDPPRTSSTRSAAIRTSGRCSTMRACS